MTKPFNLGGRTRGVFSPPPPKPCPTCYAVMRKVEGGYECKRHGFFAEAKKR